MMFYLFVILNVRLKNDRINDLFETDKKWALTVVPTESAKVFVHSADEVTTHDFRPTFYFETGYSIELLITMKQTYTTDDARQLTVGQRKCIFQNEVKLKYYKDDIYSFSTCMKYCRMEKANKLCKCIPPFYTPVSGNYRQCGLDDFLCLAKYQKNITDIRNCRHCELSCFNTVYDIEKFSRV
jgi:acid-sensing ion channel, other